MSELDGLPVGVSVYTVPDIEKAMRVDKSTVIAWICNEGLEAYKPGGSYRIRKVDWDRWWESRKVQAS